MIFAQFISLLSATYFTALERCHMFKICPKDGAGLILLLHFVDFFAAEKDRVLCSELSYFCRT